MLVHLKNTTKKLCVIGDPVLHSKSPVIQNAMLSALNLDYVYLAQPIPRDGTHAWLEAAKTAGYVGFNATMPHKTALVPWMDRLDEDAGMYQAVNTVCIKNDGLYGYNTDGRGFLQMLSDAGLSVRGMRVVVLGAGGAARAVALKLAQQGAAAVTVCNRTEEKAAALCAAAPDILRPAGFDSASLRSAAGTADLLVNGTSLGMGGAGGQFSDFSFLHALPAGVPVCDLIYFPKETELLYQAGRLGHPGLNGLGMLIHQAIFALEHFTGITADRAALRKVAEAALRAEAASQEPAPKAPKGENEA
ncbi:MAG: shikimate dehydrogenase [Intestinimonas sp.]|jgi:shikimate dehydrogenase|nr:shikimate dehydrogenase [Intestinimonas sp.]